MLQFGLSVPDAGDTQFYVTSGGGFCGPPMRVEARPEVLVVELCAP